MKTNSFRIALAALSCALATLFVALLGINTSFAFALGYVCGSVCLMLPLAKDYRWAGFLAYVATCLLCLAFNGIPLFYKLFPFVAFFGLHPLVNSLQKKFRINRWVAFAVKDVWFVGVLCATWALFCAMGGITAESLPFTWLYDWAYLIIAVGGAVLFFFYDWLMIRAQRLVDYYVAKLGSGKGKKSGEKKQPPKTNNDIADVFDDFGPKKESEEKREKDDTHGGGQG